MATNGVTYGIIMQISRTAKVHPYAIESMLHYSDRKKVTFLFNQSVLISTLI